MRTPPILQFPWMVLGVFLLIPFCLLRAWQPCMSTINPFGRQPRMISEWKWKWLNRAYGNYEDGVSGAEALVLASGGTTDPYVPATFKLYMPRAWAPWRAYLWSGWRNSTNALNRE